jgi:methionine aminopeptidase
VRHQHRPGRARRRPDDARGAACRTRAGPDAVSPARAGLVIAIEPWFLAGGNDDYRVDADGWTLRSADGSRAAHVEHTIAVTEDGPRILTAPR